MKPKNNNRFKPAVSAACVLLCACLLTGFLSACNKDVTPEDASTTEKYTLGTTSLVPPKSKDKELTIDIPDAFLSEEELSDLKGFCQANDYVSATHNKKKGTVSIVMRKIVHEFLLVKIGMTVIGNISSLIKSEAYPYFIDIDSYSPDFTEISVLVERKGYSADKTNKALVSSIASSCLLYGEYTEAKKPECKINILDKDTKEVLLSVKRSIDD